ncbi:MAG: hypothetical protein H6671_15360 [Anaerolineaceae bacterium]|nr:hypothetical protein [Anaerolineaceae bacterium]
MKSSSAGIFNLISLVFLVLTLGAVFIVITRLAGPPAQVQEVADIPTIAALPTLTPSNTPTNTQPPTFTFTPTDTLTPTNTYTASPLPTLSPTITDTPSATFTPSNTPTPSISPSPTPTATSTAPTNTPEPTLSPFLFELRDNQVIFTENFQNRASVGCAWQGIAGQVFDENGSPLNGLRVHVFGGDVDRTVTSGDNTLIGASGWEVPVDNKINGNTYQVELMSAVGTIVSQRITVTFAQDCSKNLALVNFRRTRPN